MKQLLILLFTLAIGLGYAQEQMDSVMLEEVKVIDQRLEVYATGSKTISIDEKVIKSQPYASLAELLVSNTSVNIRSYGISGLSTISFRGSGGNHSAVMWEGINLQSPSNGSLDLILLPVSFVDQVVLQFGGSSTLFGSGALGGAVHIAGRQPEFEKNLFKADLIQQMGSFESRYTGLNLKYSGENYEVKLRGFAKQAGNNFSFHNKFTQQEEVQDNADLKQQGAMLEAAYRIKEHQIIKAKYWVQDNLIHIPKVASAGLPSLATQVDYFHRGLIDWQISHKQQYRVQIKSAYVWHELIYDNKTNILSNNLTRSWTNEASWDYHFSDVWQIQTGINYTYESGQADGYGVAIPNRHRTALFTALKGLYFDKLEATLALRESYTTPQWSPFLPSLGLHYQLDSRYSIKAKVARNYRVPTFNDLYWALGGNPNLLPERGVNIELGSEQTYQLETIEWHNELTIFSNYIHNWIEWIPDSQGIWSPNNVQEAWSRGIEASSKSIISIGSKSTIGVNVSYQYIKTTKEKINTQAGQDQLGNQLIYVPYHQGNISIRWKNNEYNIGTNINYTGEQFTTADNDTRRRLDPYTIISLSAYHDLKISKQHQLTLGLEVKNLGSKSYEARANYPMPGRYFSININYQFN